MFSKKSIPIEVQKIAKALETGGFQAYLVGGCVRDLLIGTIPKDWDLTTNAHPQQIQSLFDEDHTFCNNDFGTVSVKNEETENDAVKIVEITPFRSDGTYSDSRRPDEVEFGVSLEKDLERRDFTINAIAYRISDESIVDLFEGQDDIKKKRIKTVNNPDDRFSEDALRMMRAVRLSAQLDFVIESDTMKSIDLNHQKLGNIAIERIVDEFIKILNTRIPMQGIVLLERLGMIDYILPEIKDAIGCEQGGIHKYDVYEHLLRTLQGAADKEFSTELRLAALLHDIGKPATRTIGGKNKNYSFFGHEVVGARMTRKILKRMKMPREFSHNVEKLVRWHMFFSDPDEITLSAVRRTIVRIGEDKINDLLNLRICDRIGTGRPKEQPFRFRKYKTMVDQALRDPISVKMLKINGDIIMDITGEKPGRKLGYVLNTLLEEVLENTELNEGKHLQDRSIELYKLPEEELKTLSEASKIKQSEEEQKILKDIDRAHKVA